MAGSYRSEVPGIGACTPQDSPPEEIQNLHELGYFTEMSYRSPQGELELRFDHGNEFRMGCEVWYRTRIFESGRDRSGRHPELLKYLEENHPYSMTGLHPWNRVGDKIAMPTVSILGVGFMLYDVKRSRLVYSWRDPLWRGSAWSPSHDELFLMITNNWVVLGGNGEVRGRITGEGPTNVHVSGWTPSGDSFFYLEQSEERRVPLLRFFAAETLEPLEDVPLDPAVLLPYDQDITRMVDRDGYSLPMTSGAMGVGRLLDEWSFSSMADPGGRLFLAATRPSVSSPSQFEERWVSVEITD